MSSQKKKRYRFKHFIMQQYRRTNVKPSKFKGPGKMIITWACLRTNEWTYVTLMFCFILSNSGLQAGGISSYLPTLNLHLILKRCPCWCYKCTALWNERSIKTFVQIYLCQARWLCSLSAVFIQRLDWFIPPKLLDSFVCWLWMYVGVSGQRKNKRKNCLQAP